MNKLHENFEDFLNEESQELDKIRHFKGSVEDLVSFFQSKTDKDVNNGESPRQGFKIHPTREDTESPHWKDVLESRGRKLDPQDHSELVDVLRTGDQDEFEKFVISSVNSQDYNKLLSAFNKLDRSSMNQYDLEDATVKIYNKIF